ncbi:MAG: 5-histidylcysteine sulfoxide synthase [Candidatus Obscuribacterales bacterium]|jgi:5-histidylcysteine sulfoxide synthase
MSARNPNLDLIVSISDISELSDLSEVSEQFQQSAFWRQNIGKSQIDLSVPRSSRWYTGLTPEECPGYAQDGKLYSLVIPNLATCSRQDALDYFNNTWTLSELLFSALKGDEAFYRPPYHSLRHPLIFYYVHPAVLYVNKLRLAKIVDAAIDAKFESLFETGVDEMSWDDMSKNDIEWPSIDEAQAYRRKAYEVVTRVIATAPGLEPGHAPITAEHPLWALFMGFEHERIHLETSSVLIRELPIRLLERPLQFPANAESHGSQSDLEFASVAAGFVRIGKSPTVPTFGWDNEYGERSVNVPAFEVTRSLISNFQFWQFVVDGGYQNSQYWSVTGNSWKQFRNIKWPTFWVADGPQGLNQFRLRTLFEVIDMPWDWPAVLNYHEGEAYCAWLQTKNSEYSYRLLTEAEHQRLASVNKLQLDVENGEVIAPSGNINLRASSESSVLFDSVTATGDHLPFRDLYGNVWQWLGDHFNPLPGFKINRMYDDFSTPCFDGEHQMIAGGSFISTGDEASVHARFHFRPHFFQHAGVRVVRLAANSLANPQDKLGAVVHLGNEAEVNGEIAFSYGQETNSFEELATLVDRYVARRVDDHELAQAHSSSQRALHVGCSVGAFSHMLARHFESVVAVDLRLPLISAAQEMFVSKQYQFSQLDNNFEPYTVSGAIENNRAGSVQFRRSDPCSLPADYLNFDLVALTDALTIVPSPLSILSRLKGDRSIVKVGGLLLFVSDFNWQKQVTPKELWLNEREVVDFLSQDFELLEEINLPFINRENERVIRQVTKHCSLWRRL